MSPLKELIRQIRPSLSASLLEVLSLPLLRMEAQRELQLGLAALTWSLRFKLWYHKRHGCIFFFIQVCICICIYICICTCIYIYMCQTTGCLNYGHFNSGHLLTTLRSMLLVAGSIAVVMILLEVRLVRSQLPRKKSYNPVVSTLDLKVEP